MFFIGPCRPSSEAACLVTRSLDLSANPSDELPPALGEFSEQRIVLRQEDIRTDDPGAPELAWSKLAGGEIALQMKDTQGIMDGRVTVKASTLQRLYPALLPAQLDADYIFPVCLRTVVLQVERNIRQNLGEVMAPIGPDFDTPIAQVAREDEGFFKLERLARLPPAPLEERTETNRKALSTLTPADRPSFPSIRSKSLAEGIKPQDEDERGSIEASSEDVAAKRKSVSRVGQRRKEIARREPLHRVALEKLQEIFMTEELLDACQVAKLVVTLPKVKGALIMLSDGTFMGGEVPKACHLDSGLLAPAMMRTVQEFSRQLKSCERSAFTIFGDPLVSVFLEGKICILVAHEGRGLLPGMLERIGETARALDALHAVDST